MKLHSDLDLLRRIFSGRNGRQNRAVFTSMIIPKTTLGRNVQQLRNWWDWSHAKLAAEAGVPMLLLRRIEQGSGDPKLSQLRAIAKALKVKEADLLRDGAELIQINQIVRERLRKKFWELGPDVCWTWRGAKRGAAGSYGIYQMDGTRYQPHRLVYAMYRPLMKSWDLDHTCENRSCVNPYHLEVVTRGTNLHRRDQRRRKKKELRDRERMKQIMARLRAGEAASIQHRAKSAKTPTP